MTNRCIRSTVAAKLKFFSGQRHKVLIVASLDAVYVIVLPRSWIEQMVPQSCVSKPFQTKYQKIKQVDFTSMKFHAARKKPREKTNTEIPGKNEQIYVRPDMFKRRTSRHHSSIRNALF